MIIRAKYGATVLNGDSHNLFVSPPPHPRLQTIISVYTGPCYPFAAEAMRIPHANDATKSFPIIASP
jgi:hypothetical protein